jgi:hypothetical protein
VKRIKDMTDAEIGRKDKRIADLEAALRKIATRDICKDEMRYVARFALGDDNGHT